ncbi:MAG: GH3 auxin-responsive promoter family protein [Chloroflexi bacterium]|nr:GH3 auxin-responsive promoter family protein [Chloroflexota bacterium]
MTTEVAELLKQGRRQDVWKQYCGHLDLTVPEFMQIQERLLLEQLQEVGRSELGNILMKGETPKTVEEFRNTVPLTTYSDYEPYLTQDKEHMLPRKPHMWAHTSGRTGSYKWVPYTKEMFVIAGERVISSFLLSMASKRGEVRLEVGDVMVYNAPPPPYASGVTLLSLAERFPFQFVPTLEESAELTFHQRLELSFQKALVTGIDVLGSITSVLIKLGERFAQGANSASLSRHMLHPKAITRLARGLIRSRMAGRAMLPKDLWSVKGILCGGTDTSIYKEKVTEYWGVVPHEIYGATELAVVGATQAWDRQGLYFFPDAIFLEFIPEEEWLRGQEDPLYQPKTVLLDEVTTGKRYELVITSLNGGPFLRYRMRDFLRFVSLRNEEENIHLPSMMLAGRTDDLIDLAGFTGAIDEPMIWRAIHNTGIDYEEWVVRKEILDGGPVLHVYLEVKEDISAEEAADRVHESLRNINPFYADMEDMLEVRPLRLTLLSPGTFHAYFLERQAAGADLGHLKPPHMNPNDKIVADLLRLSQSV